MNTSETINIGESFNLTGRLTDGDGRALKYTSVGVLLRGTAYGEKEYKNYIKKYARTDKDGYYSYKIEPELAGRYDICVYYPGYHHYRFNRTDPSVQVMPTDTVVTIDNLSDIMEGDNITVTGTLHDVKGNPLRYTSVGILTNENKTYTRTDENGFYNYTYTNKHAYDDVVIVYYPGYHNYGFSEEIGSFTVISISPVIDIDFIRNMHLGSSTKILGLLTTYDRKPLSNEKVNVQLVYCDDNSQYDLESCEVLTDENGAFVAKWYDNNSIYYTPKYVGEYLVQARYVNDSDYYFQENGFTVYK